VQDLFGRRLSWPEINNLPSVAVALPIGNYHLGSATCLWGVIWNGPCLPDMARLACRLEWPLSVTHSATICGPSNSRPHTGASAVSTSNGTKMNSEASGRAIGSDEYYTGTLLVCAATWVV